jgi:hypothetical protein
MDFTARVVGYERVSDEDRVVLAGQRLVGADFGDRKLAQFSSDG